MEKISQTTDQLRSVWDIEKPMTLESCGVPFLKTNGKVLDFVKQNNLKKMVLHDLPQIIMLNTVKSKQFDYLV